MKTFSSPTIQRLFPPDDERRVIHVVEQGCSVRKDGDQIIVYFPDGEKKALPGMAVSALVLHGNVQISTQVIHFCAARDIGVHWLSYGGHYVGGLSAGAGQVQRKNRQYQAFQEPLFRLKTASNMVLAKTENQLKYLLRLTRSSSRGERTEDFEKILVQLRHEIRGIAAIGKKAADAMENPSAPGLSPDEAKDRADELRGHEGMAGRFYFSALPALLNLPEKSVMHFSGRNRRPPKDPFNAALSFGYALLYRDCVAALQAVGLEPCLGFFHTPRSAAYPLALDLMELFRVMLWDMPLIGSVNRKQWTKDDFEITAGHVWLNADGRRKAIGLYENRKQEKWKHPVLNYSLSYARTIELEARLLEKEWSGSPGAFAQLRLR